jgi:Tol biopolymer transport system component
MNLWRVPIEEQSGRVLGAPEPVTTPSPYSGHLSFSRDGTLLAYADRISSTKMQSIGFDPVNGKSVGQPSAVAGPAESRDPSCSDDGRWLAFVAGGNQDDIFVIRTDGTELRQLTDDPYRDLGPSWFPDGKRILFFSNRSGRYQVWTIGMDGSGRRQLTEAADEMWYPVLAPDGRRVAAFDSEEGKVSVFDIAVPWNEQSPQLLPALDESGSRFLPVSWSPDGRRLAGTELMTDGRRQGILVYSFDDRRFEKLTGPYGGAVWLRDSRRLVFAGGDKLNLIDSRSREIKEILSAAPYSISNVSISADNRTIYFNVSHDEGDIWLATLK